jgi:hypothetical protein
MFCTACKTVHGFTIKHSIEVTYERVEKLLAFLRQPIKAVIHLDCIRPPQDANRLSEIGEDY